MSKLIDFSLDFRPSYFGPEDLKKHFGARVKGELRRQAAIDLAASGGFDEEMMSETLEDDRRRSVGAIHPSLMGGEYLPDFLDGEIEIARVVLQSSTMDVTSIRAQKSEKGFAYRIVDEYESELGFDPKTPKVPLSMGELIDIIDEYELVTGPRDLSIEGGATPEELCNFTSVRSVFYPEIEDYYSAANVAWLEEIWREEAEDEERAEREAERRKQILSPYQDRISKYVLCFGDRTTPNPRWRGHLMVSDIAKRFIEEHLITNGELPTGVHKMNLGKEPNLEHDFSDL